MPSGSIEAFFVTQRGGVCVEFARFGPVVEAFGLSRFDHTWASFYRGVRWAVLLREILFVPATLVALFRARLKFQKVDLIHLNDFMGVLPLLLARWLFKAPAIVHVRSVVNSDGRLLRTRLLHWFLRRHAGLLVAIDETVAASLPDSLPIKVIHNSFSPGRSVDGGAAMEVRFRRLRPNSLRLGFVGNLLRSKGILDLLEAMKVAIDAGEDVELLVVGGDARKSVGLFPALLRRVGLQMDVGVEVDEAIGRLGLGGRVCRVGYTADVGLAYRNMDVVCFPSHLDAPGRPIFEAAFFGVPSIVSLSRPLPDTLQPGVTGLSIRPGSIEELTCAIIVFARQPDAVARMGLAALALANANFDARTNALELWDCYLIVVGDRRGKVSCVSASSQ